MKGNLFLFKVKLQFSWIKAKTMKTDNDIFMVRSLLFFSFGFSQWFCMDGLDFNFSDVWFAIILFHLEYLMLG